MGQQRQQQQQPPSEQKQEQQQRQEQENEEEEQQLNDEEDENQTFTCEICIEPTTRRFINSGNCSHSFCNDCVVKYIRATLEDHNLGRISCPSPNCQHALDPLACATLVGPALFARWCDVLCEAAVVGHDRCYCPYRNCRELILNECGARNLKKSKCPGCKRLLCFGCKMVWHAGFACEESGESRDRNDVAFGWLAERSGWKRCPQCRHFVERTWGCRSVRCRCGIRFCYRCGKQYVEFRCGCPIVCYRCGKQYVEFRCGCPIVCYRCGKQYVQFRCECPPITCFRLIQNLICIVCLLLIIVGICCIVVWVGEKNP